MGKKHNDITPRERLRQYWVRRVPEVLEMAKGIVSDLPARDEVEEICPYWEPDYFDLTERAVKHYRRKANELIRIAEVFIKCADSPLTGLEKSEDLFMRRISVLLGELVDDKELIDAVKNIRMELARAEILAEPEAIKAIARARGSHPSVS